MLCCVGVSAAVAAGFAYYVIVVKKFNNELREAVEAATEYKVLCSSWSSHSLSVSLVLLTYALSKELEAADAYRSAAEI